MKLCYIDEHGNTGKKLDDPQQPYYVLTGIAVDSSIWRKVNNDIRSIVNNARDLFLPETLNKVKTDNGCCRYWSKRILKTEYIWNDLTSEQKIKIEAKIECLFLNKFEIHTAELYTGNKIFKGISYQTRLNVINKMIDVLIKHNLPVLYISIDKAKHKQTHTDPTPPDELAFMFFTEIFDDYLASLAMNDNTGLIISDKVSVEEKLKVNLTEYQQRKTPYYKGKQIKNVIDTIHFVNSVESFCIQLCDVITYVIQKEIRGNSKLNDLYNKIAPLITRRKHFP